MPQEKLYTSSEIAELLQVTTSALTKWSRAGLLRAHTTPGGHRRYRARDVAALARQHGMYVPLELAEVTKRRVLFVDGDAHVLHAMKRAMQAHATTIELVTAQSSVEALIQIGLVRPNVLVLDCAMPGLDAVEVLEVLKAHAETKAIDVVLVVDGATRVLERKALVLGARVKSEPISAAGVVALCSTRAPA